MKTITFARTTIERFGRSLSSLSVNRVTKNELSSAVSENIAAIYKAERVTEHPEAPCWILEHNNGRRDIHDTQASAKDDALKLAI